MQRCTRLGANLRNHDHHSPTAANPAQPRPQIHPRVVNILLALSELGLDDDPLAFQFRNAQLLLLLDPLSLVQYRLQSKLELHRQVPFLFASTPSRLLPARYAFAFDNF